MFRECLSAPDPTAFDLTWIAESIRPDLPTAATAIKTKGLQRDTLLSNIPRRSWRMIVAVERLKFFSGHVPMLENVLNDGARALRDD